MDENNPEKKNWQGFLKTIERKYPFMFALFSKNYIKKENEEEIFIELKNCSSFEKSRVRNKKAEIESICKKFIGKNLKIVFQNSKASQNSKVTQNNDSGTKNRHTAYNHPMVIEAKQIFNGEIIS